MKVYIFLNKEGSFICKKAGKVYISDSDLDKMNTYRRRAQAEDMQNDKHYWEYRSVDINSFVITPVELSFTKLDSTEAGEDF